MDFSETTDYQTTASVDCANCGHDAAWTAVSLTHIEYRKGDKFGLLMAWCSLLPIFTCVSFVTLIGFRRDLHTISYFIGLLANEVVNLILKHTIKELRPLKSRKVLFTEYGMPSSHAQFVSFFTIYLLLFFYIRLRRHSSLSERIWKLVAFACAVIASSCVVYSRVYLEYHSTTQVACGVVVGATMACIWFVIVQFVFTPFFPTIASWPVSQYLMLRDSTLIPNVLWFEYCAHREEVRSRQRKLSGVKKSQ